MLDREWRTLREIVLTERTHPLELLGGASAMLRGLWVIAFSCNVHGSAVASYLEAVLPVEIWGFGIFAAGLFQLAALARNDPVGRAWASYILTGLVGAILTGYLLKDPTSIAVPLYVTMFVKQLWIGLRSKSPINVERVFFIVRNGAHAERIK